MNSNKEKKARCSHYFNFGCIRHTTNTTLYICSVFI